MCRRPTGRRARRNDGPHGSVRVSATAASAPPPPSRRPRPSSAPAEIQRSTGNPLASHIAGARPAATRTLTNTAMTGRSASPAQSTQIATPTTRAENPVSTSPLAHGVGSCWARHSSTQAQSRCSALDAGPSLSAGSPSAGLAVVVCLVFGADVTVGAVEGDPPGRSCSGDQPRREPGTPPDYRFAAVAGRAPSPGSPAGRDSDRQPSPATLLTRAAPVNRRGSRRARAGSVQCDDPDPSSPKRQKRWQLRWPHSTNPPRRPSECGLADLLPAVRPGSDRGPLSRPAGQPCHRAGSGPAPDHRWGSTLRPENRCCATGLSPRPAGRAERTAPAARSPSTPGHCAGRADQHTRRPTAPHRCRAPRHCGRSRRDSRDRRRLPSTATDLHRPEQLAGGGKLHPIRGRQHSPVQMKSDDLGHQFGGGKVIGRRCLRPDPTASSSNRRAVPSRARTG